MRQNRQQQALAGIIVLVTVAVTLLGGIILALTDKPLARQRAGERVATSTPFHIPTLPATATQGDTPLLEPSDTPIETVVAIPTGTSDATNYTPTAEPTATPTAEPSSTPPPSATVAATPSVPVACQVPADWVPYVIRAGDNLFRIGLRYGLTVDGMLRGNCLSSIRIDAGDTLYVPPVAPQAVPTLPGLVPIGTQTTTDGACTNGDSLISSPENGAILNGVIRFLGTASIADFSFYKLEIREEDSTQDDYITFLTAERPVINGLLGEMDAVAWPPGKYWIRLTVVNSTGNYPERCARLYALTH